MKKYFKRKWEETRGDEFDSWGISVYYFETDSNGLPIRQIEVYENGNRLKYSPNNLSDDYGMMGNQELDLNEFEEFSISKEEFEKEWFQPFKLEVKQ